MWPFLRPDLRTTLIRSCLRWLRQRSWVRVLNIITHPRSSPSKYHIVAHLEFTENGYTSLANRRVPNCGGRLLSGSSGVNYGNWTKCHSVDYDEWGMSCSFVAIREILPTRINEVICYVPLFQLRNLYHRNRLISHQVLCLCSEMIL